MRPSWATGLVALGLLDSALHAFASALQGMLAAGVSAAVPSLYQSAPIGKVATLLLLHLRFACGVALDGYLSPFWEAVAQRKRRMEGLATQNKAVMRGLPYCYLVFRGRAHFSTSLPLLVFVKREPAEPPPWPYLHSGGGWGGVHTLTEAPRIGQGVHPWGC